MPRRSKKRDLTKSDGSYHPDHPNLNEHVTAVLAGVRQLKGKKKKSPIHIPALQRYYTSSRGIGTMVSPYLELKTTLEETMDTVDAVAEAGERYSASGDIHTIGRSMPGPRGRFLKVLYRCWRKDKVAAKVFITMIQKGYTGGIHYTTDQFKQGATSYVLRDPRTDHLTPPILRDDHKSHRGFNHNDMARPLVPIHLRSEFDKDPAAFRAKVLAGEIVITAEDLPSMLFSDDIVYDEDNPAAGLGTGHVFLRFLNHELVGSTGAYGEKPTGTKSSKAACWNISKVTPRIVASVTVSAWVACSSMSQWGDEDGTVDLVALHENMVDIFSINDDTIKEILENITNAVPYLNKTAKGRRYKPRQLPEKPDRPKPADLIKGKLEAKRRRGI